MKKYTLLPLLLLALFFGACAPGFRLIEPGDDGQRSVIVGDELVRYTAPPGYVDKTHELSSSQVGKAGLLSQDNKRLAAYESRDRLFEFFIVTTPNELLERSTPQRAFEAVKSAMTQTLEKKCKGGMEKKPEEGFYLESCQVVPGAEGRFTFAGSIGMVSKKGDSAAKLGYMAVLFMAKGKILQFDYYGFVSEKDDLAAFIARGQAALAAMHFEQNAVVAGSGGK
jgi:hypothetical protein